MTTMQVRSTIATLIALAAVASCAHRSASAARVERHGEVMTGAGRMARVALAVGAESPSVGGTAAWRLYDETGREVLATGAAGATWRIERRGTQLRAVGNGTTTPWRSGPLIARIVGTDVDGYVTYGGRRWRGELWSHASNVGITVVNRVQVEEYLRGVVPLELNTFAPSDAAALQAQAIAARSYVYSRLPEFQPRDVAIRHAALPYDLRSTTSDQVYGGVDAERSPTDRAIETTSGLVIRYGGAVVSAPYHSACGGSTAEPSELWSSPEEEPWLRRADDRIPGTDRHYCDIAPRFRWTRTWDEIALRGVLQRYLRNARAPIGEIRSLSIDSRTPSGRVGALRIETESGTTTLRGNDIRFAVRTVGGDILPSTYFSVDTERDGPGSGRMTRVTIRGNGNGHGVGMCQWGAVGRARAGQDYRAILRAYYPGTTVESAE